MRFREHRGWAMLCDVKSWSMSPGFRVVVVWLWSVVAACGGGDDVEPAADGGAGGVDGGRPLDAGGRPDRDGASEDQDADVVRSDADVTDDGGAVIREDGGWHADADVPSDGGEQADAAGPDPGRPHPLYQALDLDTLPGEGGGPSGPYESPALPTTSRTVTIESSGFQAQTDVIAACEVAGTAVIIPDAVGDIPWLDLFGIEDCDLSFGAEVFVGSLILGDPQTENPVHRVRVRGGQFGSVVVAHRSADVVFDGVVVNSAPVDTAVRSPRGVYLLGDVDRFAFVSSVIRMAPTAAAEGSTDGCAVVVNRSRNVLFANNNIATAGNRDSWGFEFRGGQNYIVVDNTVRVSFDAFVRLAGLDEDYVYIKGGTFMREATLNAANEDRSDSFVQDNAYGSAHVFVHDPAVYLLSAEPVRFGSAPGTSSEPGDSWQVRRIRWHARADDVVSDDILLDQCYFDPPCDYGLGTHTYVYDDEVAFPANPWRALPSIADANPDDQPSVVP
jgi:hypothetical protein